MFQFTLQNEVCKWPVLMRRPIRTHERNLMTSRCPHLGPSSRCCRIPRGPDNNHNIQSERAEHPSKAKKVMGQSWFSRIFSRKTCLPLLLFFYMCTSRVHLNESKYDCSTCSGPGCCRTPVHSCCTRLITVSINSCCPEESDQHLKPLDYFFYPQATEAKSRKNVFNGVKGC